MLHALREVHTALKEGLISENEHGDARALIMKGDRTAIANWLPPETASASSASSSGAVCLAGKIDELLTSLHPRNPERLPTYTRVQDLKSVGVVPAARDEGQRSLLSTGVTAHERRKDGRMVQLTEESVGSRPHLLRCSFAGCHRTFQRACHLAKHEKSHAKAGLQKPRSVKDMASVQNMMSSAQLKAQLEVEMKCLVWKLADNAADSALVVGGWWVKQDGRKKNRGAENRTWRSPSFKKKSHLRL